MMCIPLVLAKFGHLSINIVLLDLSVPLEQPWILLQVTMIDSVGAGIGKSGQRAIDDGAKESTSRDPTIQVKDNLSALRGSNQNVTRMPT